MRIALFDWAGGGHHSLYLRRFASALSAEADVIAAAPDGVLAEAAIPGVETFPLGAARPPLAPPFSRRRRSVVRREVALLDRVAAESGADHLVHLYADTILPLLARRPPSRTALSLLLFYPWDHYPQIGAGLTAAEWARARAKEYLVRLWRQRPDAHALLALDEEAVRFWRERRGAAAHWIPEPPVAAYQGVHASERDGCVLYGALGARKGIDLLARAVVRERLGVPLVLAGEPEPAYAAQLASLLTDLGRSASLDVRTYRHSEEEGLDVLARARCAVLPYVRHTGMSRVLLEACSVGTPVVVHDWGLLGHLVRRHRIGVAVDCRDSRALGRAIQELAGDGSASARYRDALERFTARFSSDAFARAVLAPFRRGEPQKAPRHAGRNAPLQATDQPERP